MQLVVSVAFTTKIKVLNCYEQALACRAGDSLQLCCHPCKLRKTPLRGVMKSPPKGKAAWVDIAHAKFQITHSEF